MQMILSAGLVLPSVARGVPAPAGLAAAFGATLLSGLMAISLWRGLREGQVGEHQREQGMRRRVRRMLGKQA